MHKKQPVSPLRKIFPALLATLGMTVFLGLAFFALGLNALFNLNVSVAKAAAQSNPQLNVNQVKLEDLQATISKYQDRETQYQKELQQAADQIDQINQQNLQYQQLIQSLQNAGVIQITQDGRVFITSGEGFQPRFDDDDH